MKTFIVLLAAIFAFSCSPSEEYDFYVSPDGNDNNSGKENAPFATLDRARLAVRELKKTKQGDISVGLK